MNSTRCNTFIDNLTNLISPSFKCIVKLATKLTNDGSPICYFKNKVFSAKIHCISVSYLLLLLLNGGNNLPL